jgi:hypothetical protein
MDHDLLGLVAGITDQLRQSRALLHHVRRHGNEIREGIDESGTITIIVDDEGTARDVRVAPDWRRRLSPAGVGAAVLAADARVASQRATATLEALGTQVDPASGPGADPVVAGWLEPVPAAPAQRRSVAELAEAVFAAVDDLDRFTQPPPPVHGSGAQGAVRVSMAQGRITACAVHEGWLARQDDVTLAHGLREAVGAAATAMLAARAPFVEYQQRLRGILAQAHATLADTPARESR